MRLVFTLLLFLSAEIVLAQGKFGFGALVVLTPTSDNTMQKTVYFGPVVNLDSMGCPIGSKKHRANPEVFFHCIGEEMVKYVNGYDLTTRSKETEYENLSQVETTPTYGVSPEMRANAFSQPKKRVQFMESGRAQSRRTQMIEIAQKEENARVVVIK